MRTHLRLLAGEHSAREEFRPDPFSLALQPQRPGELCETVRPGWTSEELVALQRHAAAAGLPLSLWLTLEVEAQRALSVAADLVGVPPAVLAAQADDAAALSSSDRIAPVAARRLAEYGAALRAGDKRFRVADGHLSVALDVPHTLLAAWALAAADAGKRLEEWVTLQELPPGRHLWEAAAAEAGLQLDGWLLRQAICCARSRSTAAHTAA
jgi:hypothetical protein